MASSICERALVAALAATLALAGGAGAVRAQPPPAGDTVRDAARAKLVEGVDALKRGEHQVALDRFADAYALFPSPKIHYDFGLAYVGLGRDADALSAFERFLAEAGDAPADKRDKAARYVAELRARGAAVTDAGKRESPAGVATPSPAPPPSPGPPVAPLPAASGNQTSTVGAGTSLVYAGSGDSDADMGRTVAVSLGAAGLVLIGAGVTFGVLAKNESDNLTHDSDVGASSDMKPVFDREKQSRGTRYETLQVIGLIAGAAGLAAGIVVYATTRGRVTVEPTAARSLAGANLRIAF